MVISLILSLFVNLLLIIFLLTYVKIKSNIITKLNTVDNNVSFIVKVFKENEIDKVTITKKL